MTNDTAETTSANPVPTRRLAYWRVSALAVLAFAVGFAADQLTKRWAIDSLGDGTVIELFPTVSFRLVFNPGVSFGLGANLGPVLPILLIAVTLALIGWAVWLISRRRGTLEILLVAAVAAGASGNIFDRITRAEDGPLSGHVVDFIAVDWFAIFNVADILTVCGVIAWMLVRVIADRRTLPAGTSAPYENEGPELPDPEELPEPKETPHENNAPDAGPDDSNGTNDTNGSNSAPEITR